jgi:hypothetical protein
MLIYSFHQIFKNIVSLKAKWKFKHSFLYPLFKHIWLLSKKIKGNWNIHWIAMMQKGDRAKYWIAAKKIYIFRWINRHLMLKCSYAHIVQSYPVWVYAHLFISPKPKKYSFNKSWIKIQLLFLCILCLNILGCWVRRLNVTSI